MIIPAVAYSSFDLCFYANGPSTSVHLLFLIASAADDLDLWTLARPCSFMMQPEGSLLKSTGFHGVPEASWRSLSDDSWSERLLMLGIGDKVCPNNYQFAFYLQRNFG